MPLMFQEKMRRGLVSMRAEESLEDFDGGEGEGALRFCGELNADRRRRFEGGGLMSGEEVDILAMKLGAKRYFIELVR